MIVPLILSGVTWTSSDLYVIPGVGRLCNIIEWGREIKNVGNQYLKPSTEMSMQGVKNQKAINY